MKQADVSSLRMLRQARDRIDRDYADEIGIPALAAGAGYSREHFIRAFRAAYGETPGRYRTRRRVERACELLRSANLTVTEICHLVGFASLGTFSARFANSPACPPPPTGARPPGGVAPPPSLAASRSCGAPGCPRRRRPAKASLPEKHGPGPAP
jgi:AraC-like DNA-binding protein